MSLGYMSLGYMSRGYVSRGYKSKGVNIQGVNVQRLSVQGGKGPGGTCPGGTCPFFLSCHHSGSFRRPIPASSCQKVKQTVQIRELKRKSKLLIKPLGFPRISLIFMVCLTSW